MRAPHTRVPSCRLNRARQVDTAVFCVPSVTGTLQLRDTLSTCYGHTLIFYALLGGHRFRTFASDGTCAQARCFSRNPPTDFHRLKFFAVSPHIRGQDGQTDSLDSANIRTVVSERTPGDVQDANKTPLVPSEHGALCLIAPPYYGTSVRNRAYHRASRDSLRISLCVRHRLRAPFFVRRMGRGHRQRAQYCVSGTGIGDKVGRALPG